jgi:hypothetical protein
MPDKSHLRGKVHVRVTQNVTLENLQAIVGRIASESGCQHCGLLGIDLQLSGDPESFQSIKTLPGVASVSTE